METTRKGSVMEKVANVFCGSNSNLTASIISNRTNKSYIKLTTEKSTKPQIGKTKSSNIYNSLLSNTLSRPLHVSRDFQIRRRRCVINENKPEFWRDLILDENFLNNFFYYFSPIDRSILSQVCCKWKSVLYQPKFWRETKPVLNCRQINRSTNAAENKRLFYISVQMRGFDTLILTWATDDDLKDLIVNYPVNRVKSLRAIGIRSSSVSDQGIEKLLEHFNGVCKFELQCCNEISEAGLRNFLTSKIISLTITDCINVADGAMGAVAQLSTFLQELNLQSYHVTDSAISNLTSDQRTLSILRLHSCWELTNHAIFNIVNTLSHLTVLSMSGCSKINDEGVELIAENLRKLRSLDLSWCPRVTDSSLEYIACDLNYLEELTLDRCVQISDIGVGYLSTMISLSALFLRWCHQVRDYGVQHISTMRNLQVLSLAGCKLLSSTGLSSLCHLSRLQELELTNCPAATSEVRHLLHMRLPNCLIFE